MLPSTDTAKLLSLSINQLFGLLRRILAEAENMPHDSQARAITLAKAKRVRQAIQRKKQLHHRGPKLGP